MLVEVVAGALVLPPSANSRLLRPVFRLIQVTTYNIDEHLDLALFPVLDQFRCVVRFPLLLLVLAEVTLECLLAPWAVDWVGDRRKSRAGLVHAGILEELLIDVSSVSSSLKVFDVFLCSPAQSAHFAHVPMSKLRVHPCCGP